MIHFEKIIQKNTKNLTNEAFNSDLLFLFYVEQHYHNNVECASNK